MGGSFRFASALHARQGEGGAGAAVSAGGRRRDGEEVLDICSPTPGDGAIHLARSSRAGSSATTRRPDWSSAWRPTFHEDRRRPARRDDHAAHLARVLCSADVERAKVKNPFEFVVVIAPRDRRRRAERAAAVRRDAAARHAALPVPAADRLQGQCGHLGEHRRAGQPDERRPRAREAASQAGPAARLQPSGAAGRAGACSPGTCRTRRARRSTKAPGCADARPPATRRRAAAGRSARPADARAYDAAAAGRAGRDHRIQRR